MLHALLKSQTRVITLTSMWDGTVAREVSMFQDIISATGIAVFCQRHAAFTFAWFPLFIHYIIEAQILIYSLKFE